jgi:hypothetical protein
MAILPGFVLIPLLIIKDILTFKHRSKKDWPTKMTHWVKVFATRTDNLSLTLRTNMEEGENWLMQVVL